MGKWYAEMETKIIHQLGKSWGKSEDYTVWYNQEPTENDIVDAILTKYKRQDKNPYISTQSTWKPKWRR